MTVLRTAKLIVSSVECGGGIVPGEAKNLKKRWTATLTLAIRSTFQNRNARNRLLDRKCFIRNK